MFFYLHGMIIFYVSLGGFFDTSILSISSVHFTFIISVTKLNYVAQLAFLLVSQSYSRG